MRKGFLGIAIALVLSGLTATAQIPRTLQIGVTNGVATISSQNSPGTFFGQLETTTDLSSPFASQGTMPPLLISGVSSNFPAASPQEFFRLVQYWPVFQFAIFYDLNMEIDPGAALFIIGPVFSNAGIWAGTPNLTFNSIVSAVGQVDTSGNDPFLPGKIDSGGPHFNLAGQPTSGVGALKLPGSGSTNAEAILNIPPAAYAMGTAAAYSTNGQQFLANAADLVISNSFKGTNWGNQTPYGTNITIYFQDSLGVPYLKKLTNDFYIITNKGTHLLFTTNNINSILLGGVTNVYYAGWSFVTNVAFYDYRESDTVQAVQIDVALFTKWLTNTAPNGGSNYNFTCNFSKGHTIDSLWVYNNVPLTSTTLPAVRVVNGIQLPNSNGFTVATPMPIYVYGDYNKQIDTTHISNGTNTFYTYPAALMGDAITILSGNWRDTNNASTPLSAGARNASATTVNAAMLEGIVQSSGSHYSGGVENFVRLLENWSNKTNTYNGSIVVMFPSIIATNYWIATGSYYQAPRRLWSFDRNFLNPVKLPPLTPFVVNFAVP